MKAGDVQAGDQLVIRGAVADTVESVRRIRNGYVVVVTWEGDGMEWTYAYDDDTPIRRPQPASEAPAT